MTTTCCLTIAGSDSGGGAGIQADLKAFHARGVHGTSVITTVTSQNTLGVTAMHPVPVAHVRSQMAAVFDDFPIAAVKIGMLGTRALTQLVAREMRQRRPPWLVLDPVLIATSGARLLDERAIDTLLHELVPLANVLTPNLPEAEALLGMRIDHARDAAIAAERLRAMGARAVLLKGGHGRGASVIDRWYDADGMLEMRHPRLPLRGHGTGCTLASALAAELAKGHAPRIAARRAADYVQRGLTRGYQPGRGGLTVLG